MRPSYATQSNVPSGGGGLASTREGRDCQRSHRLTVRMLFPRLDALPGPWLLFLAGMCSFVAVRALELAHF